MGARSPLHSCWLNFSRKYVSAPSASFLRLDGVRNLYGNSYKSPWMELGSRISK